MHHVCNHFNGLFQLVPWIVSDCQYACLCAMFVLSGKEWIVAGYEDSRLSSAVETIKIAK